MQKNEELVFHRQRWWNLWILGLSYALLYFGRYNFSSSHAVLSKHLNWSYSAFGKITAISQLVYAISVLILSPIMDRIGGRKAVLLGIGGAFVSNLLFGASYYLIGHQINLGAINFMYQGSIVIMSFSFIWAMNYFFQSMPATGIVKINSSWWKTFERGKIASYFGALLNMGRILVYLTCPVILAMLPWPFAFFIPASLLVIAFYFVYTKVKDKPEDIGIQYFSEKYEHLPIKEILKRVFTSKIIMLSTVLALCVGAVRNGVEHWVSRFFISQYLGPVGLPPEALKSFGPYILYAIAFPIAMIISSFVAGKSSDKYFESRRFPLIAVGMACALYLLPILSILTISPILKSAYIVSVVIVMIMFVIQIAQSLLMGALTADLGGRSSSASTAGVFDCAQYLGGASITGIISYSLDASKSSGSEWHIWPVTMVLPCLVGLAIAITYWNKRPTIQ